MHRGFVVPALAFEQRGQIAVRVRIMRLEQQRTSICQDGIFSFPYGDKRIAEIVPGLSELRVQLEGLQVPLGSLTLAGELVQMHFQD